MLSWKLCWLVAQWPRCVLQGCREWRIWVIGASRRRDVVVLEGMNGSDVMDLVLMRRPHRRLLFMIGLSTYTFLLHFVDFCLHGCYFALGFGQLVCSVQCVLQCGQLLGEDVFLLLQSLELEAHDGELILVGPRRFCNFGCSIG